MSAGAGEPVASALQLIARRLWGTTPTPGQLLALAAELEDQARRVRAMERWEGDVRRWLGELGDRASELANAPVQPGSRGRA